MSDDRELYPKTVHPDDKVKANLEKEGWQQAGREHPYMRPLNMETGRFDRKRVLSEEEIRDRYLKDYSKHGFDQVRLEVGHGLDGEENIDVLYVYMKKSSDKNLEK